VGVFRGLKYCARSFYEAARMLLKLMEEPSMLGISIKIYEV